MLDSSLVELFAQFANELETALSVILGLAFIAYGAALIVNPGRYVPKLGKDAAQARSSRTASR